MWFVRVGSQVSGPFTMEQLRSMRGRGEFSSLHQVSTDRLRWESAAQLVHMLDGPRTSGSQPAVRAGTASSGALGAVPQPAASGSGQWYYLAGDRQQVGPLGEEALRQMVASRTLSPKTMVCREGDPSWQPARERAEFAAAVPAGRSKRLWIAGGSLLAIAAIAAVAAVLLGGRGSQRREELAQASAAAGSSVTAAGSAADSAVAAEPESAKDAVPSTSAGKDTADGKSSAPDKGAVGAKAAGSAKPGRKGAAPADPGPASSLQRAAEPGAAAQPANSDEPGASAAAGSRDSLLIDAASDDETIGQAVGFAVICERLFLPSGGTLEKPTSSGSCFAVTPSGYFLTNRHVVEEMRARKPGRLKVGKKSVSIEVETALVVFFGSKHVRYEAKLIFQSKHFDMAIIKITRTRPCPYFALSRKHEAKDFKRGMVVRAIGFPGIAAKVTDPAEAAAIEARINQGLAEAVEHQSILPVEAFLSENSYLHSQTEGSISRPAKDADGATVLHHGAKIFHGNSGGPLIDPSGTVIGINTWGYNDQTDTLYVAATVGEMREEINEYLPEREKVVWRE